MSSPSIKLLALALLAGSAAAQGVEFFVAVDTDGLSCNNVCAKNNGICLDAAQPMRDRMKTQAHFEAFFVEFNLNDTDDNISCAEFKEGAPPGVAARCLPYHDQSSDTCYYSTNPNAAHCLTGCTPIEGKNNICLCAKKATGTVTMTASTVTSTTTVTASTVTSSSGTSRSTTTVSSISTTVVTTTVSTATMTDYENVSGCGPTSRLAEIVMWFCAGVSLTPLCQ